MFDYLVSGDGADMSPGHLPSYTEGGAVDRLQLDVERRTQTIWFIETHRKTKGEGHRI